MPVNYRSGIGHSAAYMVSGRPWITGSADIGSGNEVRVRFPTVAKSVTVIASGSGTTPKLRIHFNSKDGTNVEGGSANVIAEMHFIQLDGDEESFTFNVKCREIYISALNAGSGFQLYAELTEIPAEDMYMLTGSGLTAVGGSNSF
jgi:hypothetical protein